MTTLQRTAHSVFVGRPPNESFKKGYHRNLFQRRRNLCNLFSCYSKSFDYQDFQGYASPLRLLPAKEPNICTHSLLEELPSSYKVDEAQSLYMVKLQTSTVSGSCLSDPNAGILLCLIDGNGDSVLQRVTGTRTPAKNPTVKEAASEFLPFQRGSIDEFIFEGSRLGKIKALWVGPESGVWRLGALSLKVINGCQPVAIVRDVYSEMTSSGGVEFDCYTCNILVGMIGDMKGYEGKSFLSTAGIVPDATTYNILVSGHGKKVIKHCEPEDSLRQELELRSSNLVCDLIVVVVLTSLSSFHFLDSAETWFLYAGYADLKSSLLLQRSVSTLQASTRISFRYQRKRNPTEKLFGGTKAPISSLVIAFVFVFIAIKYQSESMPATLTTQQVLAAMTCFLAFKVSVLLVAFKPVPSKLEKK
ncbi:hypothetical protein Sjap_012992 [Stephania japonica]|uniref:DUF7755 domain-containing protein n=1 Tax=Stephania japonica TaxID=461633 RepID=A0AAP0IYA6_9MAGN